MTGLRETVAALVTECKCSLQYPGFDRTPFTNTSGCLAHGSSGGYYQIRKALTAALAADPGAGEAGVLSEGNIALTPAELGDLAAAYGWWKAHGDPEAFYDTLTAVVERILARHVAAAKGTTT